MHTFDTPAPIATVLDVPAGRIRVIAADRADTTVEVRPADASKSRDVQAADQMTVAYGEGVLRVEAAPTKSRFLGNSGSVEVTIHLPEGSRIGAKTAAVTFQGFGRLGEVAFEGAHGAIELDEATNARLVLESGDIVVGRLGGSAEITTHTGDIRITEATSGALSLHTDSGDITLGASRGVSASLDAGTAYGRIDNALNNNNNTSGAADLTIHATSTHGAIAARSL